MADIQKSSKSGSKGSDNDNEVSEVSVAPIQVPQVNDNEFEISKIEISNEVPKIPIEFGYDEKKYSKDINKYSSNELKEKIEHIKNAFKNSNGVDKDILKSLDNVLSAYDNLNNDVAISSPSQIKKDLNKYPFVDQPIEEESEEELDTDDDMPALASSEEEEEYNYNKSKKMDEDFAKSYKKLESESMIEIDTDGLDHETYTGISFKDKMKIGKSIGFCESCSKYYPDFIVVEHDGMPYCWHCLFWLTSTSMFGDKELEQTYGLSLEKYIEFCGPSHNKVDCFRSAECVLCNNSPNFEDTPASDDEDSTEDIENVVLELDI